MPRNSQGLYTLPPGINPVIPDTLIEAGWANPTMDDIGQALTDSLPRNGAAPMTGPLVLSSVPPSAARDAASKAYVDQFVSSSTGMPIGAIMAYAAGSVPGGFLLCNGQTVSRTTYAALFTLIGVTFGGGDGVSTFNVPNLRNQFIRGREPTTRAVGSTQASAFGTHNHPTNDPGHGHSITDPTHNHTQNPHNHGITQTPHSHTYTLTNIIPGNTAGSNGNNNTQTPGTASGGSSANITINNETATNIAAASGITINAASTGVSVGTVGDSETRPQNMAFDYYIKALNDSASPVGVLNIDSDDPQMLSVDSSNPSAPVLQIHSNVSFGMVKLNSSNKIPSGLLPTGNQSLIGVFDAAGGQNPSQVYPTYVFLNGDTFIIGDAGTIAVIDPNTGLPTATFVDTGNQLTWIITSGIDPLQPTGWYYLVATITSVTASNVSYVPGGTITATDAQNMGQQLDTSKAPKANPTFTGTVNGISATMITNTPAGTISAGNVQAAINELATEKPQVDGTGATGTWPISIGFNAATATSAASATVAGYAKQVPVSGTATNLAAGDAGKCIDLAAGMTISNGIMTAGDAVSFYNTTGNPLTLTQGGSMALKLSGFNTGANRTLSPYSLCTIWFRTNAIGIVTGAGVS